MNRFDDIGNITEDAPTTFTTHNHYPRIVNKQQVRTLCIDNLNFIVTVTNLLILQESSTPCTAFCHLRPII